LVRPKPFSIEYGPEAEQHFRELTPRDAAKVLKTVRRQLTHQPTLETRNRKRMRPNPLAPWELRIGDLRVYFHVEERPEQVVKIRAVGIKKQGNRLFIGGEEVVIGEDPQAD
jgi:mRNA-degrading endonuclease RelE of RelBE toxin-antitoxin system